MQPSSLNARPYPDPPRKDQLRTGFDTSYKSYEAWLHTQFAAKVKHLCSNHDGEYLSKEFDQYLKSKRTEQHITIHDTPEYNRVTEYLNCTLIKHVHAMICASGLPKNLWGEAIMHTTWLKNCLSMHCLRIKTPYEVLYQKMPDFSNIPI